MPLHLQIGEETLAFPLSGTVLVGRHWSCGVRVPSPAVPAFWLELRWTDVGWRWRELAGGGATRGGGTADDTGWRAFGPRPLRWGDDVALSIVPPAMPTEAVLDLVRGTWVEGDAIDALLELADGARWVGGGESAPVRRVVDGDLFAIDGDAYRYLAGAPVAPTSRGAFDLLHRNVTLDIALGSLTATFVCGARELVARGECVRVLAVYAQARRTGDGWLTREEAHTAWHALGGAVDSGPERMGWERGKLRTQLARHGAIGVRELFPTQVIDGLHETRLALSEERILRIE